MCREAPPGFEPGMVDLQSTALGHLATAPMWSFVSAVATVRLVPRRTVFAAALVATRSPSGRFARSIRIVSVLSETVKPIGGTLTIGKIGLSTANAHRRTCRFRDGDDRGNPSAPVGSVACLRAPSRSVAGNCLAFLDGRRQRRYHRNHDATVQSAVTPIWTCVLPQLWLISNFRRPMRPNRI